MLSCTAHGPHRSLSQLRRRRNTLGGGNDDSITTVSVFQAVPLLTCNVFFFSRVVPRGGLTYRSLARSDAAFGKFHSLDATKHAKRNVRTPCRTTSAGKTRGAFDSVAAALDAICHMHRRRAGRYRLEVMWVPGFLKTSSATPEHVVNRPNRGTEHRK